MNDKGAADGAKLAVVIPAYDPFSANAYYDGPIDLSDFDRLISRRYCLFSAEPDFDFSSLEANLRLIAKALPALTDIFEKPLIHLRETDEIVPIEAVRKINGATLRHAGSHSEIWDGPDESHRVPFRLLTAKTEDDYSIYENRVFAFVIDRVLEYLRDSERRLASMIFSCSRLNVNLLDRINHKNYFLALAFLHAGYEQGFNVAYERAQADYDAAARLERRILPKLKNKVYRLNRGKFYDRRVRTTNILSMHRDYKVLPFLIRSLGMTNDPRNLPGEEELRRFFETYRKFCATLLLFSIINWGYEPKNHRKTDLYLPCAEFERNGSRLRLRTVCENGRSAFILEFGDEGKYRAVLLPFCGEKIQADYPGADETEVLLPVSGPDTEGIPVRIDDADSFRRLQQVLLRGTVYSASGFGVCPFCGSEMRETPEGFFCEDCRTLIRETVCRATGKRYFTTRIKDYQLPAAECRTAPDPSALFRYRNITKLTSSLEEICPHCKKVH